MSVNRIFIVVLVLIITGCGSNKSLTKSPVNIEVIQNINVKTTKGKDPIILYPESNNSSIHVVKELPKESEAPASASAPAPQVFEPKQFVFTAVESANIRVPGINPLPSGGLQLPLSQMKSSFCYPYPGKKISNYGYRGRSMHSGIDIKAIPNDTLRAAMDGVVRMSKYYSGYGNVIVIRHYCGIETVYGHQSKNLVKPNDVVKAGNAIGLAGRTGRATTEHVHFEVRVAGEPIDPNKLVDCEKMSLRDDNLIIKYRDGKLLAYNNDEILPASVTEALSPTSSSYASSSTESDARSSAPTTVKAQTLTPAKAAYHVVSKGDTLSAIARKYGTTVAVICKLNNIGKDGILSLKQKIKLP